MVGSYTDAMAFLTVKPAAEHYGALTGLLRPAFKRFHMHQNQGSICKGVILCKLDEGLPLRKPR